MQLNLKALAWAALIIGIALLAKKQGLGNAAVFGIIAGLAGAAIGTLNSRKLACEKGPLS